MQEKSDIFRSKKKYRNEICQIQKLGAINCQIIERKKLNTAKCLISHHSFVETVDEQ